MSAEVAQSQTESGRLTVRDLIVRHPYSHGHHDLAPDTDKANFVIENSWDELDTPVTEFADSFGGWVSESYVREVLERVGETGLEEV